MDFDIECDCDRRASARTGLAMMSLSIRNRKMRPTLKSQRNRIRSGSLSVCVEADWVEADWASTLSSTAAARQGRAAAVSLLSKEDRCFACANYFFARLRFTKPKPASPRPKIAKL